MPGPFFRSSPFSFRSIQLLDRFLGNRYPISNSYKQHYCHLLNTVRHLMQAVSKQDFNDRRNRCAWKRWEDLEEYSRRFESPNAGEFQVVALHFDRRDIVLQERRGIAQFRFVIRGLT